MANGTIVGMLEYIEREGITTSESFSGSAGTTTNPYAVEDVYDLITITSRQNLYFRLVNDIDFNDHPTYKFGCSTNIGTNTNYLSGKKLDSSDRYRIRNVIFNSSGRFRSLAVSDVIFSNIIVNSDVTISIFQSCMLTNCSVGIFANKALGKTVIPTGYDITDTSFNIKGTITSALYTNSRTFTRSHIYLNNLNVSGALFDSGTFTSSYITGSVTPMGSVLDMYCSSTTWADSYAAVKVNCDSSVTVNTIPSSGTLTCNGTCFIDKGLLPDTAVLKESTNLYYLTTEQATDPDYLNSIGFVVAAAN